MDFYSQQFVLYLTSQREHDHLIYVELKSVINLAHKNIPLHIIHKLWDTTLHPSESQIA